MLDNKKLKTSVKFSGASQSILCIVDIFKEVENGYHGNLKRFIYDLIFCVDKGTVPKFCKSKVLSCVLLFIYGSLHTLEDIM